MANAKELLKKASRGEASTAELDDAAAALSANSSNSESYTLLLAIGRSMQRRYRAVVERFLGDVGDPMLTRLALQVLCAFWGETERYLAELKRFLAGVPWDNENDVRQMAVSLAGEYLRSTEDRDLLRGLISMVDDETLSDFQRSDAYLSVARAMGRAWEQLPALSKLPPFAALVDGEVVSAAKQRLSRLDLGRSG